MRNHRAHTINPVVLSLQGNTTSENRLSNGTAFLCHCTDNEPVSYRPKRSRQQFHGYPWYFYALARKYFAASGLGFLIIQRGIVNTFVLLVYENAEEF